MNPNDSKNNINPDFSIKKIRALIWLPIGILTVVFFSFMSFFVFKKSLSQTAEAQNDIEKSIKSQKNQFSSELFFGQKEALIQRLNLLEKNTKDCFENISICLLINDNENKIYYENCPNTIFNNINKNQIFQFFVGQKEVGQLKYKIFTDKNLSNFIPKPIIFSLLIALSSSAFTVMFLGKMIEIKIVRPLLKKIESGTRNDTILQTTQMLAHDIKKPISLFNMYLSILDEPNDKSKLKEVSNKLKLEIQKSVTHVDNMIKDVMEIKPTNFFLTQEISVHEIILESLKRQALFFNKNKKINLIYKLNHDYKINVNISKTERIFDNIISNAIEEIQNEGTIYFYTKNILIKNKIFIETIIQNTNSYISPENIENIFEPFFSLNKKHGTGLGLAVVRQMVINHGGSIRCESTKEHGVKFIFTLPALKIKCNHQFPMPKQLDELKPESIQLLI